MIPSAHRVDTWEEGYYSVKRIVNHRLLPDGTTEYEYEWKDKKLNGEPWPNSWSTADDLTPDLIQQYEERRGYGVPSKIVDVNCALVYEETRRTISHALMFAAPNASGFQGRNRPSVHDPVLVLMSIQTVALGVLDIARKDGGPTLEITTGKTSGQRWWQLIIKDLERIGKFCSFERFLTTNKALQNVRITGTSKWSGDMLAVAQPLVLTIKETMRPGIVQSKLCFPTVHFNGRTGRPTYPHMSVGMLKSARERKKLIKHVRDTLPEKHPLRRAGWCAFPADVEVLAVDYAIPCGN